MASKEAEAGYIPDPAADPNAGQPTGERYELKWGLSLDLVYMKSVHGILTAAITLVSLIGFICVEAGRNNYACDYLYGSAYSFYGFTAMSCFLTGIFNYVLYIFTFYDKIVFKFVPWALADLVWGVFFTFFYFIAALVAAVKNCGRSGVAAGSFFGFVAFILVGAKTYLAFKRVREERAQAIANAPTQEYSAERNQEQY